MYMHTYSVYLSILLSLSPVFAHVHTCTRTVLYKAINSTCMGHIRYRYGPDRDHSDQVVINTNPGSVDRVLDTVLYMPVFVP